jgi:hypothetical protein
VPTHNKILLRMTSKEVEEIGIVGSARLSADAELDAPTRAVKAKPKPMTGATNPNTQPSDTGHLPLETFPKLVKIRTAVRPAPSKTRSGVI